MTRFEACLPFILAREGGKVDDPADRGGRTAYGITQRTYDSWRGGSADDMDVWDITRQQVANIYKSLYWTLAHCDDLPAGLDLAVFDAAVNHGVSRSVKFLQRALAVTEDGVFGVDTKSAMESDQSAGALPELIDTCISIRRSFYHALVVRQPSQERFARGWENRLQALAAAVHA